MRILITGASGSGSTTLGKALASKLGHAWLDMDDFYWLPSTPPFQHKRDPKDRLTLVLQALAKHTDTVVSGSILNWGAALEDAFDHIVFLYLDSAIRVRRLKQREEQRYGAADPAFLQWAAEYDEAPSEGRSLAKHQHWLAMRRCPILRLEGDLSVSARVQQILDTLVI